MKDIEVKCKSWQSGAFIDANCKAKHGRDTRDEKKVCVKTQEKMKNSYIDGGICAQEKMKNSYLDGGFCDQKKKPTRRKKEEAITQVNIRQYETMSHLQPKKSPTKRSSKKRS